MFCQSGYSVIVSQVVYIKIINMSASPEAPHPSSLITDAHVQGALNNDKGPEAQLKSWNVKDFTKKGDNYASYVTRINVTYKNTSTDKEEEETSYVAKLNPLRDSEVWNLIVNQSFKHEGEILTTIMPVISQFLAESKQDPLRVPACYLQDYTCGKELLIVEDLGRYGYKMIDRKKGLDSAHLKLVIAEIARMNAAVQAYEEKHQIKFGEKFPILEEDIFGLGTPIGKMFEAVVPGQIDTSIKILTALNRDEETIDVLKKFKKTAITMYFDMIKCPMESKFSSISHGDCWSNNFLFRYDAENNPVEVMLLDLQMTKIASVAVDLNHVLFSTLQPSQNKGGLQANLADYHATYTNVMNKAGATPRFTLSELVEEFKAKNPYGYVIGLVMVPFIACEGDDLIDLGNADDEIQAEQMMAQKEQQLVDIALAGGVFKQRFLALIEEIKESGFV